MFGQGLGFGQSLGFVLKQVSFFAAIIVNRNLPILLNIMWGERSSGYGSRRIIAASNVKSGLKVQCEKCEALSLPKSSVLFEGV